MKSEKLKVNSYGSTPTGWKETTLGEVAELAKDKWLPGDVEKKYIGLEHINQGNLQINGFGNSSSLQSNKFYFRKGDVLFGKLRPYFRKVWKAQFDGVCSTDIWVIRTKEGYDQNFLFYFMANPVLIDKSTGASTGTKMPRADWDFLKGSEWLFPPLPEQKAIAAILSTFDDKIELLRRQNKTLESIAQTIFKEWFVKFTVNGEKLKIDNSTSLPEGWRIGKYGDLAAVTTGKGLKKEFIKEKGVYSVLGANGELGKTDNYLFNEDLILTGRVGTLGTVYISRGKAWISDNVLISKPLSAEGFYFVYFNLKRFNFEGLNRGSTQPLITQTDLKNVEVIIPKQEVLEAWHNVASPVFAKIYNNNSQIQTLSKLRDALLPKLMKGEIKVKDF